MFAGYNLAEKYSKTRKSIGKHFRERTSWDTSFPGGLVYELKPGAGHFIDSGFVIDIHEVVYRIYCTYIASH